MTESEWRHGWLRRGLNLVGAAIVVFGLSHDQLTTKPTWALVLAFVATAAWVLRALSPERWSGLRATTEAIMLGCGALATVPTDALALIPVIAAILSAVATLRSSRVFGLAMVSGGVVLIAVGALTTTVTVPSVVSMEAGLVVAAMVGFSRRQSRIAEAQARTLAEERVALREEHSRTTVLAERSRMARDIHDVLAHSLGGLVIQLDAVEALLEAGDTADAAVRVRDSRELAASGLGEARRAVKALHGPDDAHESDVAAEAFVSTLTTLVGAETTLGGAVTFEESGDRRALAASTASAVRRAFQEALSNARKHAPGEPVAAQLDWRQDAVVLTVENPLPTSAHALAATGGGHGLTGMRERFDALPAGGRAAAGVKGRSFVVRAEGRFT